MMQRAREIFPAAYLALALLLGGSTSGGAIVNAIVQIIGVVVIVQAIARRRRVPLVSAERQLFLGVGAVAVIGLIQLIPLPPALWTSLPGRGPLVEAYALMGMPLPALPISLWPAATVSALAALIPPVAAALLVMDGGSASLRPVGWTLVAITALSFLLGIAQVAGGQQSPLYFYDVTNDDQLVGFFANSNHLATLGVMSLPFLAALAARDPESRRHLHRSVWKWAALGCVAGFIVLGVVVDGSVAGILLLAPSIAGGFLILRAERPGLVLIIVGIVVIVAVLGALILLGFNSPLLRGFANTEVLSGGGSRQDIFEQAWAGVQAYFPFGAGLGSFILAYPALGPANPADISYTNHAHSDVIEFAFEMGLPGIVLMLGLFAWVVRQSIFAWRAGGPRARFARAASVAIILLMAHSLVDYPGRTAALAVLFAAACAMLARPLPSAASPAIGQAAETRRGKMLQAE